MDMQRKRCTLIIDHLWISLCLTVYDSELNAFMSGFEYVVAHSQPPDLFVIHRREVESSGKRDRVTGAWFILHEKIYQCPTLFDVMSTRLVRFVYIVFFIVF